MTAYSRCYVNGLWANPPGSLIDRLYREAKKVYPKNADRSDPLDARRISWSRKVHDEFHLRLKAAGIYVEGGL